jgi:hypothetical protein
MKVKIKRNGEIMEVLESEIQDGDERVTETQQDKDEKKFTQADLNRMIADERRKLQKKYDDLNNEFTTFKTEIQTKEQENENKLKGKAEAARKDYPEPIVKLLDKMTYQEQLDWISENPATEKPVLPNNPKEKGDGKLVQKPVGTIF